MITGPYGLWLRLTGIALALGLVAWSIYVIVTWFQWHEIFMVLRSADMRWFLGGGLLSLACYWPLRTARWWFLLRQEGIAVHPARLYLFQVAALGMSVITPFQSGEALKIELLERHGHTGRAAGYRTFALERCADLLFVTLAAACFILNGFASGIEPRLLLAMAGIVLAMLLTAWLALHRSHRFSHLLAAARPLAAQIRDPRTLAVVVPLTALAWLAVAFGWHACLRSVAIDLPIHQVVALVSIMTLVNLASLIPGAVGVSEAGTATILAGLGINVVNAQAGAFTLRAFALSILVLAVLHALIALLFRTRTGRL